MNGTPKTWSQCIVEPLTPMRKAMEIMEKAGKRVLLLTDAGKLVGIVTDGDIRRWILMGGGLDSPAMEVATRTPRTIRASEFTLPAARQIMQNLQIDIIPVVDANNNLVDVCFWKDIFEKCSPKSEPLTCPVVIMAGGKGSRLDPITRVLPKPLIPIGDKPIIERIIDSFTSFGCNDFIVSVNFKSALLKAFFAEANLPGTISYIEETSPLGTAGALAGLRGRLREPFFVTNCDVLVRSDYTEALRQHKERNATITILAALKHYRIPYGVVRTGENGRMTNIDEKPTMDFLINTGVYILSPAALEYLKPNTPCHMTDLIAIVQKDGGTINVHPVSENAWMDMGQVTELKTMLEAFD
jgi:dTDP-glucose pyrophosphorylase